MSTQEVSEAQFAYQRAVSKAIRESNRLPKKARQALLESIRNGTFNSKVISNEKKDTQKKN